VVGGHRQKEGIDFNETFAPVIKHTSIRILLGLATVLNWEVHQMDFVTAFLNGCIEENIYMKQPVGYEDGTERVCKLNKSLYGLKQAPRQWNIELDSSMKRLGFQRIQADHSVYKRRNLIVAVYVDDCILASKSLEEIEEFKLEVQKMYKVKDLGELKIIVGMQWKRNRKEKTSILYQEKYTSEILERFGMTECKLASTPAVKLITSTENFKDIDLYQQAVGCLIYLNTCTRPDISLAVSLVARKMSNPSMDD